ncbi:MAG: arsenate reductase (glutaredoxin) [Pseudomonadota bacterium]
MSNLTIYHNPRCSKSRQTLALIEDAGASVETVLYLDDPISKATLKQLLKKLGLTPRELMRKGEAVYKELGLKDDSLSDAALMDAMLTNPKLIERPIVVKGDQAVLGRPPENVQALL